MRRGDIPRSLKFRAFVSVDISPSEALVALLDQLREGDPKLKVVKSSNLHVTLKFLGDTDEGMVEDIVRTIEESVKGVGPFSVRLQGMGAFPSLSNIRVVWVGIEDGRWLAEMADTIDDSFAQLGFKREKRAFRPHLTVARARGTAGDVVGDIIAANTATDYGEYRIDRVALKKSVLTPHGPIYSDVRTVALS